MWTAVEKDGIEEAGGLAYIARRRQPPPPPLCTEKRRTQKLGLRGFGRAVYIICERTWTMGWAGNSKRAGNFGRLVFLPGLDGMGEFRTKT